MTTLSKRVTGGRMAKWMLTFSVIAALSTLTPAAQATEVSDAEVAAALARIGDGTWTDADAELIGSIPELAATLPDPRVAPEMKVQEIAYTVQTDGTLVSTETVGLDSADVASAQTSSGLEQLMSVTGNQTTPDDVELPAEVDDPTGAQPDETAAGKWKWTHVTVTNYSYLGSVIYKFHHKQRFKYNGSKVTNWGAREHYISNESSVVSDWKPMRTTRTAVPSASGTSYVKYQVKLSAPVYGEYATNYPWSRIKMKGTGATSFTSSNY